MPLTRGKKRDLALNDEPVDYELDEEAHDETPRTRRKSSTYSPWEELAMIPDVAAIDREADSKPSAEEHNPNVFRCKDGLVDIPPECREYKFKFKWSELKDLIKKDIEFEFSGNGLEFRNGAELRVCHNNGTLECTINLHTLTDILEEDSIGQPMWEDVAGILGAKLISKEIRTSSPVHGEHDPTAEGLGLDLSFD